MKESKKTILWGLGLLAAFTAGAVVMHVWEQAHTPFACSESMPEAGAALLTMEEADLPAALPKDAQTVSASLEINPAEEIPSQLVKINLPELARVHRVHEQEEDAGFVPMHVTPPVVLADARGAVTPQAAARVTVVPDGQGNTTMIQVPAAVKLITNLDEYKAFKRIARGKYPEVDFSTHRLAVLQTAGDFPDSALEITEVADVDGNVQISYRVNVFGMDQKTNTHAFTLLRKTKKPVVVKQVL